jgi:CP family cyanate transporter-like MFS transporter
MAAGMLLRGLAPDSWSLLAATAVVFAGVGSGNVLLPPLVKRSLTTDLDRLRACLHPR